MGIVYPDVDPPFTGRYKHPSSLDAVNHYITHYNNFKYLKFIHDNTQDGAEKRQANLEIQKAIRKMDYWLRMRGADLRRLEVEKKKVDVYWAQK